MTQLLASGGVENQGSAIGIQGNSILVDKALGDRISRNRTREVGPADVVGIEQSWRPRIEGAEVRTWDQAEEGSSVGRFCGGEAEAASGLFVGVEVFGIGEHGLNRTGGIGEAAHHPNGQAGIGGGHGVGGPCDCRGSHVHGSQDIGEDSRSRNGFPLPVELHRGGNSPQGVGS